MLIQIIIVIVLSSLSHHKNLFSLFLSCMSCMSCTCFTNSPCHTTAEGSELFFLWKQQNISRTFLYIIHSPLKDKTGYSQQLNKNKTVTKSPVSFIVFFLTIGFFAGIVSITIWQDNQKLVSPNVFYVWL